ncbi:MAG: hypothetical protein ACLS4Z_08475 [Christensenellaceae bacterium]
MGNTSQLPQLAEKYRADEIFDHARRRQRAQSEISTAVRTGLPVRFCRIRFANGQITVCKLRKVEIQDLLGQEQVSVNLDEIMGYIENKPCS